MAAWHRQRKDAAGGSGAVQTRHKPAQASIRIHGQHSAAGSTYAGQGTASPCHQRPAVGIGSPCDGNAQPGPCRRQLHAATQEEPTPRLHKPIHAHTAGQPTLKRAATPVKGTNGCDGKKLACRWRDVRKTRFKPHNSPTSSPSRSVSGHRPPAPSLARCPGAVQQLGHGGGKTARALRTAAARSSAA